MPLRSTAYENLPHDVDRLCKTLGERIRTARKRRRLSQKTLADMAEVSRQTIQRIEAGDLAVGLGIFLSVVWSLRLEHEFEDLLNPERDREGLREDFRHLPQRIGHHGKKEHRKYDPESL